LDVNHLVKEVPNVFVGWLVCSIRSSCAVICAHNIFNLLLDVCGKQGKHENIKGVIGETET